MKYAIFGTGNYCKQFIHLFAEKDICFFLDNNKEIKEYVGKPVYTPEKADFSEVDYVVILIQFYIEVEQQLLALGLQQEKVITYPYIASHMKMPIEIQLPSNKKITGQEWLEINTKKKILCVMHDYTRTGVPVAVMNMARLFSELDYDVLVGSMTASGPMKSELMKCGLDCISSLALTNRAENFETFIGSFDLVLLGTIALADYGRYLSFYNKTIVWWINENYPILYDRFILPNHKNGMKYFLDGKKTADIFEKYYPDRKYDMLYYYLPEEVNEKEKNSTSVVFATIGAISKRKAQDILLKAIDLIDNSEVEYWIIGSGNELGIDFAKICNKNPKIKYWDEVSQEELKSVFSKIDVLVCPSRDDTAPIVVSQAFQNCIPCIVSDAVGQSEFMKDGYAGYVFSNENVGELALAIKKMINIGSKERKRLGKQARVIFDNHFSKASIKRLLIEKIIE